MSRSKEGLTSLLHPKDLLAASAKCRMCSYLINRLKHRSSTISPDAKVVVNVRYFKFKNELDAWRSVDLLQIRIKCDGKDLPWLDTEWSILAHRGSYYPQTPVYSLLLQLTLPRYSEDPAATDIKWSPVNYNVDSSAEQAKSWIEQCKLHEHCPELRVPQLPTRVLDISNDKVRLHVPRNEQHHYCALSYSWGGPQPIRTLTGNIESHKAGIRITDLPQTIQDAIRFSRQLGIKYLWIDSLCIVQDSVEDKHREIARMASIYQNAFATIAATNTSRCTDGFLSKRVRPEREIIIEDLPWSCDDGSFGQISLHWQFWRRVDQEPLNQRAWTLQERVLSPRVLSFGSYQLAWECQTARYTDGGNPRSVYDMGINRLESYIFSPLTASTVEKSPQGMFLHYTWTDAVMDLSRRKITEESDKLPAISGVAQQMHLITGDSYLAGLWKASLHLELMWLQDAAAEDFLHAKRPTTYRAPSWSWASVEGTVTFSGPFEEEDLVAEVIQCEVLPVDPSNLFGAVSGGHLVINGPLRSLDEKLIPEYFQINSTDAREVSLAKIYLDGDEILPSSAKTLMPNDVPGSAQTGQRIWFLDMARNKHGDPFGYVLRQQTQQNIRVFRRIGWFENTTRSIDKPFWTQDTPVETITII
ncbi:unnamed protein product [Alternaria alternata]